MEDYISGETHHRQLQEQHGTVKPKDRHPFLWVALAIIAVLIGVLGVFIFSKPTRHVSLGSSTQGLLLNGNTPACSNGNQCLVSNGPAVCAGSEPCSQPNLPSPPTIGTVTAVSASSITEQFQNGSTQTFTITSNTQIGIGPGAPNKPYGPNYLSYVHVGEGVGIMADSSNSGQAKLVMPLDNPVP